MNKIVRAFLLSFVFIFNVVIGKVHAQDRLFKSKKIQCDATSKTTELTGISQLRMDYKNGASGFYVTYKDFDISACRSAYFYSSTNFHGVPITPFYDESTKLVTNITSEQALYLNTGNDQPLALIHFQFDPYNYELSVKLNATIKRPTESVTCRNLLLVNLFYRNEIQIEGGYSELTFKNCKVIQQ